MEPILNPQRDKDYGVVQITDIEALRAFDSPEDCPTLNYIEDCFTFNFELQVEYADVGDAAFFGGEDSVAESVHKVGIVADGFVREFAAGTFLPDVFFNFFVQVYVFITRVYFLTFDIIYSFFNVFFAFGCIEAGGS